MKKKDFIIVAVVLLLAGVLALVFRFTGGEPGGRVQVKVDGKVVGTYALVEEQRVPFDTKYGHNTLVIEGGKAHIEDAVMGLTVSAHKASAVHTQNHMQITQSHVVDQLVKTALQETGIHGKYRF